MNAPAYPKTKSSGIEWLGDVPEHWEVRRLKFAIRTNPVKSEIVEVSGDSLVSFVPMDAVGEYGGMNLEKEKMVDEVYTGYTYFADGDVVIAKITPCFENGKGAIAAGLKNGIGFGTTEFHVLRAEKSCDRRFLFYLTISHPFRKIGASEMLGAGGQKRVPEDFIKNLTLGMPPVSEQRAIAEFLDRKTGQIDQLIGKKKELIQKLNEQRSALITAAVTGKLQSEIGNPHSPMCDSGIAWLGKIPEHWNVRRLKFLTKVIGGGTPSTGNSKYWNGDIPWVSPKDMKSDLIDSAQDNITELGAAESATKVVQPNTVLIVVRSGILRHTIPVARNTVAVALNQDMKGFTPENGLTPEYLHLLIVGNQKQLLPLWSKPGCTVESLEVELMMNTGIPAPPVQEQQAIAEYLDEKTGKIDGLIRKTETAIQTLEEYRTALITAAVTGKIDVRAFTCR